MTKTMSITIFKWVPGNCNSPRSLDFEELLGFGNSDFEHLDLFRISPSESHPSGGFPVSIFGLLI
jgi:hypothetical protein